LRAIAQHRLGANSDGDEQDDNAEPGQDLTRARAKRDGTFRLHNRSQSLTTTGSEIGGFEVKACKSNC
jgi:hypothetical protein